MALYTYRALTSQGKTEKGTLNAASENEAKAALKARKVYPLEIKPSRPFSLGLQSLLSFSREPRLSVTGLANFCRQFGTLLDATIPYDAALDMIVQQTSDVTFKSVLSEVRGRVVEGAYLADALTSYPKVFPRMVVSMVRSGEASGTLAMIMHRLADYYENMGRLRSKLASAMVYPAFMSLFSFAVVTFMITFIVPKITRLFDNFGVTLPLTTRMLIAVSEVVTEYWWVMLITAVVSGWGLSRFLRGERGRMFRDRLELAVPLWKDLRAKMIVQQFTQTLATMLQSGVELKDALEVSSQVMENQLYLQAMERAIFDVQNRGLTLSVALQNTGMFPQDVCQMVAIGEETASLEKMLDNVSSRLSREVGAMMDGAAALLEPVMILVMGVVVGFIVISIMLPMLQLNQLVG